MLRVECDQIWLEVKLGHGSSSQHIVYALADPDTHHIRYVGRTGQTATKRLYHHLGAAKRGCAKPLYDWIRGLMPRTPLLVILQKLQNQRVALGNGRYESAVEAAETKWMKLLRAHHRRACPKLEETMPRSKPLSIGGKPFEIQKAAQLFIQELLNSQPLKVAIPEPHHSFLCALISRHPRAAEKIVPGIKHFTIENAFARDPLLLSDSR